MRRNNICGRPLCVTLGRRPKIGLDIDGVLRNSNPTIKLIIERKWPKAKLINPATWEISEKYENVPEGAEDYLFNDKAEEIFYCTPIFPGANKFVQDLEKLGKLVYVTAQKEAGALATLRWLGKNNFNVGELHIIHPLKSKTEAECDILIDDSIRNLKEQQETYGGAVCRKHPWNVTWKYKRFESFDDICEEVSNLISQMKIEKEN